MSTVKNVDDWEWQWQLAIKLSKNEGLPDEVEYWDGLEEKIMSEIVKAEVRKDRREHKDTVARAK